MQKEFVSSIESVNKATVDAVKRLGEIQIRTMERLAEQNIEATSKYMSEGVKQLQSLAGSKDMQAVMSSQSKYVSSLNESVVENAKAVAGILNETRDELTEWAESGMKAVANSPLAKAVSKKVA